MAVAITWLKLYSLPAMRAARCSDVHNVVSAHSHAEANEAAVSDQLQQHRSCGLYTVACSFIYIIQASN